MKRWIKRVLLAVATILMSYGVMTVPAQAAASWFFPDLGSGSIKGYCYRVNDMTNKRVYVYADERCENRKEKEYISARSDECYIVRLSAKYDTVYVSYPTPSGRKYRWVKAGSFTGRTSASQRYAAATIYTYKFASSSYGYGSISPGDKVYVYETYGSYTRVVYPLSTGGYKMAWIRTTDANNYLKSYQSIKNGNYVMNSAVGSSMVMEVYGSGTANGTNIQLYRYHGGNNQKFKITSVGNGWYTIRNVISNKAVDVSGGVSRSGVNVQLWDYNGSDAQLWRFYSAGNGYYYIQNKLGYYLDVSGGNAGNETNIWVYSLNRSNAQKWKLSSTTVTSEASTLRISGQAYPGTMNQGSGFTIRGTISSNYKITKVRCGIYNSSGAAVSEKTVYPNSYSYNVNSIDSYIHFSYAKPGTNYYRVWATDAKGTKLLQNTSFKVVSGNTTSEKRKKVVNYMRAMATVKWTPQTTFKHWSGKRDWCAGTIYYGIPYSQNCRVTTYERFISNLRGNKYIGPSTPSTYLGSDCSSAVSIAWQQADSSFSIRNTYSLQPDNPKISMVGNYSYSAAYCSNTRKICSNNGTSKMYSAYKNLQPGDAVVNRISSNGGHAMLVTSVSSNSIKVIEQTEYDPGLHSTWRVDKQYSFSELYAQGYLPVRLSTM